AMPPSGIERPLHRTQQLCERQRLLDEIEGAEPGGLDGGFHRAVPRHHHHRAAVGGGRRPFAQQRDAIDVRHPDVEQHEVGNLPGARGARLRSVGGDVHLIAFLGEDLLQEPADVCLVIDYENMWSAHACCLRNCSRSRAPAVAERVLSFTGITMRTRAPPSGRLSASIRPPCSSMIFFTIASPSPVPFGLLVTYGSNTRARSSRWKPGPLSHTVSAAYATSALASSLVLISSCGLATPSSASSALVTRLLRIWRTRPRS